MTTKPNKRNRVLGIASVLSAVGLGINSASALTATSTASDVATAFGTIIETGTDTTLAFITNTTLLTVVAIGALFMFFWKKMTRWF